jgi:hypothetical protein
MIERLTSALSRSYRIERELGAGDMGDGLPREDTVRGERRMPGQCAGLS